MEPACPWINITHFMAILPSLSLEVFDFFHGPCWIHSQCTCITLWTCGAFFLQTLKLTLHWPCKLTVWRIMQCILESTHFSFPFSLLHLSWFGHVPYKLSCAGLIPLRCLWSSGRLSPPTSAAAMSALASRTNWSASPTTPWPMSFASWAASVSMRRTCSANCTMRLAPSCAGRTSFRRGWTNSRSRSLNWIQLWKKVGG